MILRKISGALYRALVMTRHPEAIRLAARGIDYDQYRDLCKPWLLAMNIRTILDVGANVGQFAILAHEVFPSAKIFSFEPLPECFEVLKSRLSSQNFQAVNV